MIAFVKEAEALQEKGQLERLKNEEGELKVTLQDVASAGFIGGGVPRSSEATTDGSSALSTVVLSQAPHTSCLSVCLTSCLSTARITQLVRGFSSSWKQSVEAMSQDVMRSFTNFKNGTSIIQVSRPLVGASAAPLLEVLTLSNTTPTC